MKEGVYLVLTRKTILLSILLAVSTTALAYEIMPTASNSLLAGTVGRKVSGSNYWTTSNLREWLNSTEQTVQYTNNPPLAEYELYRQQGYADEAGFLSNFTQEELNQIAITKRRTILSNSDKSIREGGTTFSPHANDYSEVFLANEFQDLGIKVDQYFYKTDYDKMFLLNPNEFYWYITRRGFSESRYLTEAAARKHQTEAVKKPYWLSGGADHGDRDVGYVINSAGRMTHQTPYSVFGVLPAFHMKPETITSNGKKAKDLAIGETIIFGRYLGEPIKWEVINKTADGYPLLLSSNILDLKYLDGSGDSAYENSMSVNWGTTANVSIIPDLQYRSTTGSPDKEVPLMTIKDKSPLEVRQNNPFTLEFSVSDPGSNASGIDWIELPDGKRITQTQFTYTFDENKQYVFKLMDKAGNMNEHMISISNINIPAQAIVNPSTEEWTNQDVEVDVFASTKIEQTLPLTRMTNVSSASGNVFPNFISYANSEFRIHGKVKLKSYKPEAAGSVINIGVHYKKRTDTPYTQKISGAFLGLYQVNVDELISKGEVAFDFTTTIRSDYSEGLMPWFKASMTTTIKDGLVVEFQDVVYEMISSDDFAITSITLPDGRQINASKYTDTITTEGVNDWSYKILDNRGQLISQTITTKIDKTKPTIQVKEGFIDSFSQGKEYLIQASDVLSGIESIEYELSGANQQPLRSVNGSTASIVLKNSGATTLKVRATDRAGNTTEMIQTITVDPFNPCLSNYDGNRFIISDRLAQLELEAIDQHSGIVARQYKANDEAWSPWIPYDGSLIYWDVELMREGLNTFFAKVKDGAGNISDPQEAEIVYDPVGPTITDAEVTPYYTNQSSVQVHVVAEDNYEPEGWTYTTCIQLSNDGTNWTTYSTQTGELTVKDWTIPLVEGEQVLYVRGIDNSLNIGPVQEVPYVVDLTAPTGSIIINDDEDFVQEETATLHLRFEDILNGIPDLSGVAQIELFNVNGTIRKTFTDWDWTTHQKDYEWTLEFYEKTNKREYAQVGMIITDRAGNETVIYSKEVELAKLMIKDFHLTNVVNPSVYNKNNPFQLLTYPNFPPQPLLLGASFSYQLDYECLIELKDNWTFEYDLVVLYEKPDGSIVENKETVQAPIRGLSLPLGSFNHDHLLPNEGLPTSTQVYFGTTFRILDENGDLIASDTYPKDSSINGTFVPSNMILIGEIKGHIKDLIRFNEFN